jgi:DNA-binding response OmpR family regulator
MANLLVIEDEAPLRANLVRILSAEGYRRRR